jgi:hypothetical protein
LEGLAELVPDIKARRRQTNESGASMNTDSHAADSTIRDAVELAVVQEMEYAAVEEEKDKVGEIPPVLDENQKRKMSMLSTTDVARRPSLQSVTELMNVESMRVNKTKGEEGTKLADVPSKDASKKRQCYMSSWKQMTKALTRFQGQMVLWTTSKEIPARYRKNSLICRRDSLYRPRRKHKKCECPCICQRSSRLLVALMLRTLSCAVLWRACALVLPS